MYIIIKLIRSIFPSDLNGDQIRLGITEKGARVFPLGTSATSRSRQTIISSSSPIGARRRFRMSTGAGVLLHPLLVSISSNPCHLGTTAMKL